MATIFLKIADNDLKKWKLLVIVWANNNKLYSIKSFGSNLAFAMRIFFVSIERILVSLWRYQLYL